MEATLSFGYFMVVSSIDTTRTTFSENNKYQRGNTGEN